MKKTKNIIQFVPYSNPHIWGVEDVSNGIYWKWTYWKSSLVSGCQQQESDVYDNKKESRVNKIWVNRKVFFPDFEIVDNFPIPRIWTRLFWKQWRKIREDMENMWEKEDIYVVTHTRFFLSSLIWWVFARKNKLKWIHIEHGSDYVKLASPLTSKVAYLYDRIIWKWILKKANKVLCISSASKNFVTKEFWRGNALVWNRWIDIWEWSSQVKNTTPEIYAYIWRLVSLKWVDILLRAYWELETDLPLVIIWDGVMRENLEELAWELWIQERVSFLGYLSWEKVLEKLSLKSLILVNPSYQEWMPTTVIEGLITKNVVIASDVWGTQEISQWKDLVLFPAGDISELRNQLEYVEKHYASLQWTSYTHMQETFSWENSLKKLYNHL